MSIRASLLFPAVVALIAAAASHAQETPRAVERVLADGGREVYEVIDGPDGTELRDGAYRREYPGGAVAMEGRFERGQAVDQWRFAHPDGSKLARGRYREGLAHGRWNFWYADSDHGNSGKFASGKFEAGDRNGGWEFWDRDGSENRARAAALRAVVRRWPDGAPRLEAGLLGDAVHGPITVRWPDGTTALRGWLDLGRPIGTWSACHADGFVDPTWMAFDAGGDGASFALREALLAGALPFDAEPARPDPNAPARDAVDSDAVAAGLDAVAAWLAPGRGVTGLAVDLVEAAVGAPEPRPIDGLPGRGGEVAELLRAALVDPAPESAAIVALEAIVGSLEGYGMDRSKSGPAPERVLARLATMVLLCGDDFTAWDGTCQRRDGEAVEWPGPRSLTIDRALVHFGVDAVERSIRPARREIDALGRLGTGLRKSLTAGVEWLVRHQSPDGSWKGGRVGEGDCCGGEQPSCDGAGVEHHDVGLTALALLAFADVGLGVDHAAYGPVVHAGLRWLVDQREADTGKIGARVGGRTLYDHALATEALARHLRSSSAPDHRAALIAAVGYLERARNPYSGWHYAVPPDGTTTTASTHRCSMALAAALEVVPEAVESEALRGALSVIDELTDPATGRTGYDTRGTGASRFDQLGDFYSAEYTESLTALAAEVRLAALEAVDLDGDERRRMEAAVERAVGLLSDRTPRWSEDGQTVDFYYWRSASRVLRSVRGESPSAWRKWEKNLTKALLPSQRTSPACFEGSWDPVGPWGDYASRIYSTAMGVSTLAVYVDLERRR